MDPFNAMLLDISDKLSSDNLSKLKFLCRDKIGKKKLEEVSSGVQLFEYLIERGEIGPNNRELLETLLGQIGQQVLVDIIRTYEGQATSTETPAPEELGKIDCAIEVIVQELGRKWRPYGRKLGISETKLDGIQEKHPRNLEEQVREMFKEWKKMRKAQARVDELLRALRNCDQNYTADLVEKTLAC